MPGLDETENEFRWRLQDPSLFDEKTFRTKDITDGISLILGKKKGQDSMEAQALRFDKSKFDKEQARKWITEHKGEFKCDEPNMDEVKYELPQTYNLSNIEIFSIENDPNGDKYTEKDLEEIAQGFQETKSLLKPYIKLGHDDNQFLAQKDGLPAFGWIENVQIKGKKLLADISKIPKKIYELIQSGAYRRVSSEIFWNIKINKKTYRRLLKAVSFLGADTPACLDLNDIISLYMQESKGNEILFEKIENFEYELNKKGDKEMEELEKAKKENEELKTKLATIETEKKDLETKKLAIEQELEQNKTEKIKAEVDATISGLIKDYHLLPKHQKVMSEILTDLKTRKETKKYKLEEKEVNLDEAIISVLNDYKIELNTEGQSETGKMNEKDADNEKLRNEAVKYSKEHNVSFKEALRKVSE